MGPHVCIWAALCVDSEDNMEQAEERTNVLLIEHGQQISSPSSSRATVQTLTLIVFATLGRKLSMNKRDNIRDNTGEIESMQNNKSVHAVAAVTP